MRWMHVLSMHLVSAVVGLNSPLAFSPPSYDATLAQSVTMHFFREIDSDSRHYLLSFNEAVGPGGDVQE